jgi:hypothetical protein
MRPNNGIQKQQLLTHATSPTARPGADSGHGVPRLDELVPQGLCNVNYNDELPNETENWNKPEPTFHGFIVLKTVAHFFSGSCSADR